MQNTVQETLLLILTGEKAAYLLEVIQQRPQLKTYCVMSYLESTVKVGEAVFGRLGRGNVSKIMLLKLNREEDELKNLGKLFYGILFSFFFSRCTNRKYLLSAENSN